MTTNGKNNSYGLPDLASMSDAALICLRAGLQVEMRNRKLAFHVGEIGERLVVEYFNKTPSLPNLQHAPTGTKNVDAISRGGDRYSIKTVWLAKKTGTIYPDEQDPSKQLFEYLVVVQLGDDLSLQSVVEFPWDVFKDARSWDKRMNAWYIGCSRKNLLKGRRV